MKVNTDLSYNLIITPKTIGSSTDSLEETYSRMREYLDDVFGELDFVSGCDLHPFKRMLDNGLYEIALIVMNGVDNKDKIDEAVKRYLDTLVEYEEIEAYTIDEANSGPCECEWEGGKVV